MLAPMDEGIPRVPGDKKAKRLASLVFLVLIYFANAVVDLESEHASKSRKRRGIVRSRSLVLFERRDFKSNSIKPIEQILFE